MSDKQVPTSRRPSQTIAAIVAAAFLAVGVLGFIPGITTQYGDLRFAGPHSGAQLFGVFGVSVLHNVVHLVFGLAGFLAARRPGGARAYLMIGGLLYLVLWIYGIGTAEGSAANFVPLDQADDWLHLGLGAGLIVLGIACTTIERARGQYPSPRHRVPDPEDAADG